MSKPQENPNRLAARVARKLGDGTEDGPLAKLCETLLDRALNRTVGSWLDREALVGAMLDAVFDEASTPSGSADRPDVPARLRRHIVEAAALERARAERAGDTLGDWIPEEVVRGLEARLARPLRLPAGWSDGVVKPAFLRTIVAGALGDVLEGFLDKLPLGGMGLLGQRSRGGRQRRGTGVLGGIGGRMQDNLLRSAHGFAESSAGLLRERILLRLRAPEHSAELDRTRRRAVERLLELRVADLHTMADDPGAEVLTDWAGAVWRHNAGRAELRLAVEDQLRAALARVEGLSAADLLEEAGLQSSLRPALLQRALLVAREYIATAEFGAWLSDLLASTVED